MQQRCLELKDSEGSLVAQLEAVKALPVAELEKAFNALKQVRRRQGRCGSDCG